MIPYINFTLFEFRGVSVHMFGVLVVLGTIIGDRITVREGAKRGLDPRDVRYLNVRMVIGGFVMAHLVSVIFYFPERIAQNPWVLLYLLSGLSSMGGFLGAAITYIYLTRKEKIPALRYADAVALGLAVGWIFGRLGCTTAHDHPGRPTNFFLAVQYPGGPRHDLGLYELLFTIALTFVLYAYARTPRREGRLIGLFAFLYAPARFCLDFLRATDGPLVDHRYGGLTPAQWVCLATFAVGVWLLARRSPVAEFCGPPPADPPSADPASSLPPTTEPSPNA